MPNLQALILLAALTGLSSTVHAEESLDQRIDRLVNNLVSPVTAKGVQIPPVTLAERMQALHVPGVSIAVIRNGKIEWARGFGVKEIGGPAVSPETLFQAASISKPVTALAAMRLVEAGKLNLDDDVNSYLKNWKVPANTFTDQTKVTLRELLSHTAGVTVHGFRGYIAGSALPSTFEILEGKAPANTPAITVDIKPGTLWRYSGGGYVIAKQVLDDVTGKPFPAMMRQEVLGPAGMVHSTFEQPLPAVRMLEVAMPYDETGTPAPHGPLIYPEFAPDGLWTTASDLAEFALTMQRALSGQPDGLLKRATAEEMLRPGLGDWGLGFQIGGDARPQIFYP